MDLWRQLFEWESASFDLYPSWWSDRPMRNPLAEPTDFRNASWARVYLPLRTGREAEALEFIFTGGDPRKLDPALTQITAKAIDDPKTYRKQQFGTETGGPVSTPPNSLNEKVVALGQWEELLPDTLPDLFDVCKKPATTRISYATLCLSFQEIYSGCCAVAAHTGTGGRTAKQPPDGPSDHHHANRRAKHPQN